MNLNDVDVDRLRERGDTPLPLFDPDAPVVDPVDLDEVVRLRERLAEFERTRSTGGPAPAMTRDWGNEQHVPPPESASRRDMDPPTRYGASNQKRSTP